MKKLAKISIIVPVYNTGEYLHKCIQSVLAQTLDDFELILVDDGSTDNSAQICDEYAKNDSRVNVIHKENEGVSVARNTGIKVAQGEFIGFIDSDDWVEPSMYQDLYELAQTHHADIVMCDAVTKYDDREDEPDTITQLSQDVLLKKQEISPDLLLELAGSAWRCIYRRDLLIEHNIKFPVGIPLSEDRIFNLYAFGYSGEIYYKKTAYYNRYVRKGSAVSKYYNDYLNILLQVREATQLALDCAWDSKDEYKTAYENQTVGMTFSAVNMPFYQVSPLSFKQRYQVIKEICNCKVIRQAIKVLNVQDIRATLITKKQVLLLCILAKVVNKRYDR